MMYSACIHIKLISNIARSYLQNDRKTTVSNYKMLIDKQTTAKIDDCVTTYI